MDEMPDQPEGLSRRKLMQRAGLAGVAVWSAPLLTGLSPSASAASGVNPNPECAPATCTTFIPCSSSNSDCVCTSTSGGGGFCVPGSTSCGIVGPCGPGFSCAAGQVCVVNTCCGEPVCAPIDLNESCPSDAGAGAGGVRASSGPGTFGG